MKADLKSFVTVSELMLGLGAVIPSFVGGILGINILPGFLTLGGIFGIAVLYDVYLDFKGRKI